MSRFPSGWKSRGDSWGVGYGRPRHRPVFAHGGVRSRGVRHHSGRRCWPYIQAHQQVHDVAGSRGRLVATRCDKLRRAGSLSAGDSFAPAAVLALPHPPDSSRFDGILDMGGVADLDGTRERGKGVLRRVSGAEAMLSCLWQDRFHSDRRLVRESRKDLHRVRTREADTEVPRGCDEA